MKPCKTIVEWSDVQSQVRDLNAELWHIIDAIPEAKNLPLSIVSYPYGDIICDDKYYFDIEGNEFDKKSAEDFPMFLLLKGRLELYLDTTTKMIPQRIYSPGELFPYNTQTDYNRVSPSALNAFTLHSGVRNLIVMSLWSNTDTYKDLKKKFGISNALSPSNPDHHYFIAKQMLAKEKISWESKLLCFNKEWIISINSNPKFWPLREYLYKLALQLNYYQKNSMFLDYAINDIAQTKELKLNSYSLEILKTLLFVSLGDSVGIRPSINNDALPQNELYTLFSESNKNDLAPIIIEPYMPKYGEDKEPFYYSLDAFNNTANMQKTFKSFYYLNILSESIDQMLHHFKEHPLTKTTVYSQLSDRVEFNYYSERGNDSIRKIDKVTSFDPRFDRILNESHLNVPKRSIISKALIAMNYK